MASIVVSQSDLFLLVKGLYRRIATQPHFVLGSLPFYMPFIFSHTIILVLFVVKYALFDLGRGIKDFLLFANSSIAIFPGKKKVGELDFLIYKCNLL